MKTSIYPKPAKRILLAALAMVFCLNVVATGDLMAIRRDAMLPLVLINDRDLEPLAVKRVQPAYPPMAQKYRIEGTVVVQLSVAGDGKVAKAEFVRGHNIFRSVSLDAAKRWEFRSSGDRGLEGTVQFTFKLNN